MVGEPLQNGLLFSLQFGFRFAAGGIASGLLVSRDRSGIASREGQEEPLSESVGFSEQPPRGGGSRSGTVSGLVAIDADGVHCVEHDTGYGLSETVRSQKVNEIRLNRPIKLQTFVDGVHGVFNEGS